MKKIQEMVVYILFATSILFGLVPVKALAAGRTPLIALEEIPVYGDGSPFKGRVYMEDGSAFNPSDYRISLYLQLYEGGTYWVKPTYATPYADISADGSFSIQYATGGYDWEATILHVMLISANYTPGSDYDATRERALDYVKVLRTEDGTVTAFPDRRATGKLQSASGLSVSQDKLAVDVGFYTDGSAPGSALDASQIRRQLNAVSGFSDTVRFYGSAGELRKAYKIAHDMGFSIVGTAWLSGDGKADKAELDALIQHCNDGYVSLACVGSETLLRGDLSVQELLKDIDYVKKGIKGSGIAVSTAESAGIWIAQTSLREACGVLMLNVYPYWEGVKADKAMDSFISAVDSLKAVAGGKEIIISETGWPTEGGSVGEAKAGEAESADYFANVREWSISSGTVVLWFDAADEPWKTADEGEAGAHWGLMSRDFALKDAYKGTAFFRAAQMRS